MKINEAAFMIAFKDIQKLMQTEYSAMVSCQDDSCVYHKGAFENLSGVVPALLKYIEV